MTPAPLMPAYTAAFTSYAPAAGSPGPQAREPLPPSADAKSHKRKAGASPLPGDGLNAWRSAPLTTAVALIGGHAGRSSERSTPAFARGGQTLRMRPLAEGNPRLLPAALLARVAAFAADDRPLAYLTGLLRTLRVRSGVDATTQNLLLELRPETLLESLPPFRTRDDWRRYFAAGGTLEQVPPAERSTLCLRMAVTADPRSLRHIPAALRTPELCLAAVRADGYALESVPRELLEVGSPHRATLVAAAYASPRPPRIRDVPADLLTEARCIRSLQWAPLDLPKVPASLLTTEICLASIRHTPAYYFWPAHESIPPHLRDGRVAVALAAHGLGEYSESKPPQSWYRPGAITQDIARDYLLWLPQEIIDRRVVTGPVRLEVLAEVLSRHTNVLGNQTTEDIEKLLMESARAEGLGPGDRLPAGRWPEGVLPRDLSEGEVRRWATGLGKDRPLPERVTRQDPASGALTIRRPVSTGKFFWFEWASPDDSAIRRPALTADDLLGLPPDAQTLSKWEALVAANGENYLKVPMALRSWPLLCKALRNTPDLMDWVQTSDQLLPGGITEAMWLEAVEKVGLAPGHVPQEILLRPSFREAVRALPSVAFNREAIRLSIPEDDLDAEGTPQPDPLTIEWIDRHIKKDPSRATLLPQHLKLEWAVASYRHYGADPDLYHVHDSLPRRVPWLDDLLAEIGPFPERMDQHAPWAP